jgi:hypothetical protein
VSKRAMNHTGDVELEAVVAGAGPVTVVFENGLGTSLEVWDHVAAPVAERTQLAGGVAPRVSRSPSSSRPCPDRWNGQVRAAGSRGLEGDGEPPRMRGYTHAPESGHYMPIEAHTVVVTAIMEMLESIAPGSRR